MVNFDVKNRVIDLTTTKTRAVVDNIYRETLRELLNKFGNLYYIDGNGNRVQVKCAHGDQDRLAGLLKKDNTLILPYVAISDIKTSNSDERRRYSPVIISEKIWDPKRRRAERYVSLSPRPINLTYKLNIWAKYKSDLDMIRSNIFGLFNPDLNIRTRYSDFCKAYIESEDELGDYKASDTSDRLLQKTITIVVETYIPSPKFLFTSTGEIKSILFDILVEDPITGESTAEEVIVEIDEPVENAPEFEPFVFSANLGSIDLDLSLQDFFYTLKYQDIELGILSLSTSLPNLHTDIGTLGEINSIILSALDLSSDLTLSRDLGINEVQLTDDFLSESNNNFFRNLGAIEVYLTTLNSEALGVNLDEINLQLSSPGSPETVYNAYANLARIDLQLSSTDIITTLLNNQLADLDVIDLALSSLDIDIDFTSNYLIDLGQNELLLTIEPLEFIGSFNRSVDLSQIEVALTAPNIYTNLGINLDASSNIVADTSSTTTYSVNADLGVITLSATLLDLSSIFVDSYNRDLNVIQLNLEHVELEYDSTDGVSYNRDLEEIFIGLSAYSFNTNLDEMLDVLNVTLSSIDDPATEYSAFANLARIDLQFSSLDLVTELLNNQQVDLDSIDITLSAIEFSSTQTDNYFLNIGQNDITLTTEDLDRIISDYKFVDLDAIEVSLTAETLNTDLAVKFDVSSNVIIDTSSTTTYSVDANLGQISINLSALDAVLSATGNSDLGIIDLALSSLDLLYDTTTGVSYNEDLGIINLVLSAQDLNFNLGYDLGTQDVTLSAVVTQITEYSAFADLARIDITLSALDIEVAATNESNIDLGQIGIILSALDLESESTNQYLIDLSNIDVVLTAQQFNHGLGVQLDTSSNIVADTSATTTYSVSADLGQIEVSLSALDMWNSFEINLEQIGIDLSALDIEVSTTVESSFEVDLQEISTILTLQTLNHDIGALLEINSVSSTPDGNTYYEIVSDLDTITVVLTVNSLSNDIGLNLGTNQVQAVDPDFEG